MHDDDDDDDDDDDRRRRRHYRHRRRRRRRRRCRCRRRRRCRRRFYELGLSASCVKGKVQGFYICKMTIAMADKLVTSPLSANALHAPRHWHIPRIPERRHRDL